MKRIKKFYEDHDEAIIVGLGAFVGSAIVGLAFGTYLNSYKDAVSDHTVVSATHWVGEGIDNVVLHMKNGQDVTVPGRH